MAPPSIIVFGPTGNVACIAAKTAAQHGAKVFLAMRDTTKAIPGLSLSSSEDFERVSADLTKPDTVQAAVSSTGAKRAFIYAAHATSDHMKSTVQALKTGGIEFVVFLSSYTIMADRPLQENPPQDIIPYMHAQVEIQLLDVFGEENFVALRPGGFATNVLTWSGDGIRKGEVDLWSPEASFDCIAYEDMGEVAGVILAKGKQDQHAVYLFGPQFLSQEEQIKIVGKALGKEIKITSINEEQAVEAFKAKGMPEVFAKYLASKRGETRGGFMTSDKALWEEGVANVEKYTGHKVTAFEPWVKKNLDRFQ